jgi:hypothetical protein
MMNFAGPVFRVRVNLVFVGICYKHLEYKASKASPFCTTVLTVSGLCIPQQAPCTHSKSRHERALFRAFTARDMTHLKDYFTVEGVTAGRGFVNGPFTLLFGHYMLNEHGQT